MEEREREKNIKTAVIFIHPLLGYIISFYRRKKVDVAISLAMFKLFQHLSVH